MDETNTPVAPVEPTSVETPVETPAEPTPTVETPVEPTEVKTETQS